jgi:hypothetical protein
MNFKHTLKQAFSDRAFFFAWLLMALLAVAIIILGATYIRPSDLQLPVRYSSFGITNFYRDKWYYLISFVLFGLLVLVMHTGISLRLLAAKGRAFALAFLWMTVAMLLIASVTIYALFRVVTLSQ